MASEPKPMSHERLLLIAQAHADQTLYDSDLVDLYDLVGELISAHGYWLNEAEGLAVDVDEQRAEVARLRGLVDRAIEAEASLKEARTLLEVLDSRLVERQRERDEARRLAEHWRSTGWGAPEPERSGHLFPWEVSGG